MSNSGSKSGASAPKITRIVKTYDGVEYKGTTGDFKHMESHLQFKADGKIARIKYADIAEEKFEVVQEAEPPSSDFWIVGGVALALLATLLMFNRGCSGDWKRDGIYDRDRPPEYDQRFR